MFRVYVKPLHEGLGFMFRVYVKPLQLRSRLLLRAHAHMRMHVRACVCAVHISNTPMHWAAVKGHGEIMQWLIKKHFPVSNKNKVYTCCIQQECIHAASNKNKL